MIITNCLCVKTDTITDLDTTVSVLKATRVVLSLTYPDVSLDWTKRSDSLIIFGSRVELAIVEQVFRVSLGLFVEIGESTTSNFNSVEAVANSLGVQVDNTTSVEDVANGEWTDEEIEHIEIEHRVINSTAIEALRRCSSGYGEDEDEGYARQSMYDHAINEMESSADFCNNPMVDSDVRVAWRLIYDRLHDTPRPTESASGQFSIQEQIDYSQTYNPRNWNLVKTRFDDRTSGFYLTYLCPPTVNIYDTLRIVGGPNADRRPVAFEICVYNTESYWRELRHQMHQGTTFLRETVAA